MANIKFYYFSAVLNISLSTDVIYGIICWVYFSYFRLRGSGAAFFVY